MQLEPRDSRGTWKATGSVGLLIGGVLSLLLGALAIPLYANVSHIFLVVIVVLFILGGAALVKGVARSARSAGGDSATDVPAFIRFERTARPPKANNLQSVAQPIAHTPDGEPVYQVVGYTPDGRPVTADQAVGYQQFNPKTNSMAVAAMILGFVVAPLAIPFGHIARGQIRQTGEQGGGMALAGLIMGYLIVASLVVLALAFRSVF